MPTTPPSPTASRSGTTTDGDPTGEPLLLVMGLGAQTSSGTRSCSRRFVDRGFFVIRFDNRDVGLSTKPTSPTADVLAAASWRLRRRAGARRRTCSPTWRPTRSACSTHLGIEPAHVVGASMGGMIAQTDGHRAPRPGALAHVDHVDDRRPPTSASPRPRRCGRCCIRRPPRPRGGDRARRRDRQGHRQPRPLRRGEAAQRAAEALRPLPTTRRRRPPAARHRRLAATAPRRSAACAVPTLVIHGDVDPLVTLSGGAATAEAVPGAELLVLRGHGPRPPRGPLAPGRRRHRPSATLIGIRPPA